MPETTAAPAMSALAELVLIATRKNLPTPRYMTVSDGGAYHQISLTLNSRDELDAWNAEFGDVSVSECPPTPEARDFLITTMHGGSLLGWSVNLQTRVPLPLSAEMVAELGGAQADADVLVAETVAALDDFQAYLTVACPACKAAVGELCHGRDSAQWSHINRRNASALERAS